jgi:hypothetical protein
MQTRCGKKGQTKTEWFEHAVGHLHRSKRTGIKIWLHGKRMLDGNIVRGDVASGAPFQKSLFESKISFRESNKKTVVQFQKIRHDLSENHIFIDAFDGRFPIRHTVTAARVKQAMVAPRGARGHFPALDDGDAQSAQREIVRRGCTCRTGTDYYNVGD